MPANSITIEMYGIARQRSGVPSISLQLADGCDAIRLDEVLRRLTATCAELQGDCVREDGLGPACIANLDGDQFVTDLQTTVRAGQTLMLLSADAGG